MSRVLFFDIDGTLYRNDCLVPESTLKAIDKCRNNGDYVIICTGRNNSMIPESVRRIPYDGMIGGSGVYVAVKGKVLTDAALTGKDCGKVLEILRKYRSPAFFENSDYFYYDETWVPDVFKDAVKKMQKDYSDYYVPLNRMPERISKITAYPEDRSVIPKLTAGLAPWFDVLVHEEYLYIEITMKNYSKGTGVEEIVRYLGVDYNDTYAFGDSMNDLAMLERAAHAVVMGNAPEELKKKFDVTDDIYNDGLVKAMKKLKLI